MKTLLVVLLVNFLCCAAVFGQSASTAQINGTVHDSAGLVVPQAVVKVTQTATGLVRTVITTGDGAYLLTNLPIGPYQLEVTKDGFSKYVQAGIVLQVDSNPDIDVGLKVGSISEQVVVEANATMVETHSTGIGAVVDNQSIVELPLNGREATQLIFLNGLANPGNGANLNSVRNYPTVLISVAGGMGNGITYLLDGATHNDPFNNLNLPLPFPDALQEFKVETSALPAQYGHHSSAAVNGVTKSGTNEFHGDLFEFIRNGDLNARNFFATSRDSLKRNQFGGVIGGPVKRDELFFFAGYQGSLQRSDPASTTSYVPTAAELAGDFTTIASTTCQAAPITLSTAFGFVGNKISPALLSPLALKAIAGFPTSNDPCGKVIIGRLANSDEHLGVAKVDYQLTPKHSVFGRVVLGNLTSPSTFDGKDPLTVNTASSFDRDTSIALGDTYLVSSNTVSSFHLTLNRTRIEKQADQFYSLSDLGVQNVAVPVPHYTALSVSNNGFTIGGASATPSKFNTTSFQIAEDIGIVRGAHQLGFGVNYIHPMLNFNSGLNAPGTLTFGGTRTVANNASTGVGFADFLTGNATQWSQGGTSLGYNRAHYVAVYLQDSWKVTSHLTVSYGLRWEPYLPVYSKYGQWNRFDRNSFVQNVHSTVYPLAPAGVFFPGDPQWTTGNSTQHSRWNEWAPRLGVVWDPQGNGRMTIRAAYGIFTDRPHLFYNDAFANDAPYGNAITNPNPTFVNPWLNYPGGNPFPFTLSATSKFGANSNIVSHNPDAKPTYLNQWNLSIQRQLAASWLLSGTYVGNNTIHLWTGNQGNPAVYLGTGPCTLPTATGTSNLTVCSTTSNTTARRSLLLLNPAQGQYIGTIAQQDDGGTASYNGLLLSVQHRMSRGLSLSANYTLAHCISDLVNSELGTQGPVYTVPNNRRADRSNCVGSDRRQTLNVTGVAQAPKFTNRMVNRVAGGWQLSLITTLQSAQQFTVTTGVDNAFSGQGNHPNLALANPYNGDQTVDHWLNPLAFVSPANGTYGTVCCSNLNGPGKISIDMALSRTFKVREKQTLQLRWEAFNVPNHNNPNNPTSAANSGTFGKILTGNDPRIMQAALKYIF